MTIASTTATGLLDWSLLGRVVIDAAVAGIGIVVLFAVGLVGLSMARKTTANSLHRGVGFVLGSAMTIALAWTLWWGFELIVKK